jgi:hypothetical protein
MLAIATFFALILFRGDLQIYKSRKLTMSATKNCFDCKYLVKHDLPDDWLRVGDYDIYCDNENAVFDGHAENLDPDCVEEYPETCGGFEAKDKIATSINSFSLGRG